MPIFAPPRPPVEGTVARGQLHDDTYFYTGKFGSNPGDYMPFPVTMDVLSRGRERFNIYCAPCHSRVGDGNGMIVQRGFRAPPSYHTERLRKAPLGYFFDVMTNGFGAMPEYATQVPARDRWCIVAYIRALQLSQDATMSDVPSRRKSAVDSSRIPRRSRLRRNFAGTAAGRAERRSRMSAAHVHLDLTPPPVVKIIERRSLVIGLIFAAISLGDRLSFVPINSSAPTCSATCAGWEWLLDRWRFS